MGWHKLHSVSRTAIIMSAILIVLVIVEMGLGINFVAVANTVDASSMYQETCSFKFYQGMLPFVLIGTIPDLIALFLGIIGYTKLRADIVTGHTVFMSVCFAKNIVVLILTFLYLVGSAIPCSEPSQISPPNPDPNMNVAETQFDVYFILSLLALPFQLAVSVMGCTGRSHIENAKHVAYQQFDTKAPTLYATPAMYAPSPYGVPPPAAATATYGVPNNNYNYNYTPSSYGVPPPATYPVYPQPTYI